MDLYYNDAKLAILPIYPTTTVGELKQILANWLIPQGVTDYKVRLFFNNGTELAAVVFQSNAYDAINFESQANLLKGASVQVITKVTTPTEVGGKSREELNLLTIPKLKDILKELGVKTSGNKQELIERILSAPGNKTVTHTSPKTPPAAEKTNEYFKSEDPEVAKIFTERLEKGKFSFTTLDNGAEPFRITVEKNNTGKLKVILSDNTFGKEYPREDKFKRFNILLDDVDTIWLGSGSYENYFDRSEEQYLGNTALLVKGNTCISVARDIEEFTLSDNERVTRYISSVGNSAVPYGWIETNLGYYALESFNCDTGFLPKKYVVMENIEHFECWGEGEPFNRKQGIKGLKTLIPQA